MRSPFPALRLLFPSDLSSPFPFRLISLPFCFLPSFHFFPFPFFYLSANREGARRSPRSLSLYLVSKRKNIECHTSSRQSLNFCPFSSRKTRTSSSSCNSPTKNSVSMALISCVTLFALALYPSCVFLLFFSSIVILCTPFVFHPAARLLCVYIVYHSNFPETTKSGEFDR